jgi:hypothetical protein
MSRYRRTQYLQWLCTCKWCGAEFVACRRTAGTCSPSCRQALKRAGGVSARVEVAPVRLDNPRPRWLRLDQVEHEDG